MANLKLYLLSSLILASCSTLNKHKSIQISDSTATDKSIVTAVGSVHAVTTETAGTPVVVVGDSLHATGVLQDSDTGTVTIIDIDNGNTHTKVTGKKTSGGFKVDATTQTKQKTITAPVNRTRTVDSNFRTDDHKDVATEKHTVTKDKQVSRTGLPWWLYLIGGLAGLIAVALIAYRLYKKYFK